MESYIDYVIKKKRKTKRKIVPRKKLIVISEKLESSDILLGSLFIGDILEEYSSNEEDSDEYAHPLSIPNKNFNSWVELNIKSSLLNGIMKHPKLHFTCDIDKDIINSNIFYNMAREYELNNYQKRVIQNLFAVMFKLKTVYEYNEGDYCEKHNLEEFYQICQQYRKNDKFDESDVQHYQLIPKLRPYQIKAVKWMLNREKKEPTEFLNPLYEKIDLPNGNIIYYCHHNGDVQLEQPKLVDNIAGGILADEMGLGKTVEILALILNNPRFVTENTDDMVDVNNATSIMTFHKKKKRKCGRKNVINETDISTTKNDTSNLKSKSRKSSFDLDDDIPLSLLFSHKKVKRKRIISENVSNSDSDSNDDKNVKINDYNKDDEDEKSKMTNFKNDVNDVNSFETNRKRKLEASIDNEFKIAKNRFRKISSSSESDRDVEKMIKSERQDLTSIVEDDKIVEVKTNSSLDKNVKIKKNKLKFKSAQKLNLENYSKKAPKKTEIRQNAELWYEMKLSEVNQNPLQKLKKLTEGLTRLQCLCGEMHQCDQIKQSKIYVKCNDCEKFQHRTCVDFDDVELIDSYKYFCPQCWEKQSLLKTRATLIISPQSISRQWLNEIRKHVKKNGLKILIYNGISRGGYMYPTKLMDYDLVLTTYQILRGEIRYSQNVELNQERFSGFRQAKRYHLPTSPLRFIEWWRICLDEAQIVDCPQTQVAEMANKLTGVHKWAVSGTPAQKSISDLQGLIKFLNIIPYTDPIIWTDYLYKPFCYGYKEPLYNCFAPYLWRSTKLSVIDQINIPKQTEEIHWLEFSAVEKFFYNRERELCASIFEDRIRSFEKTNITLDMIDRNSLNSVLSPLLSIRQACTHPYAVKGRYLSNKSNVMSMEDLLEALIGKHIIECEDTLRVYIASLNGLAGINMICSEWLEAAQNYRDVLRLIDEHKNRIKVDTLPHLHTLYNLAELIEANYPGAKIPPTLHDDTLRSDAEKLQLGYIKRHTTGMKLALSDYLRDMNVSTDFEKQFVTPDDVTWFMEIVQLSVNEKNYENELMQRFHTLYIELNLKNCTAFFTEMENLHQVKYEIGCWWDKAKKQTKNLRIDFKKVREQKLEKNDQFSETLVNDVVLCHLRPMRHHDSKMKKSKKICFMCRIEKNMLDLECLIFSMAEKKVNKRAIISVVDDDDDSLKNDENDDKIKGTWKPSPQESFLKAAHSFALSKKIDFDLMKDAEIHFKLLSSLKKEFKSMRRLWTFYGDIIASQDEVTMCKQRLRLRLPGEELPKKDKYQLKNLDYDVENKLETIHIIDESMLELQRRTLENERDRECETLNRKLGTLNYLETLKKQRSSGSTPDPCPICKNLVENLCVLNNCGHSFCIPCIHHILENYSNFHNTYHIQCPVCRREQPSEEITYIKYKDNDKNNVIQVAGSYSTKVEAILRCILELRQKDRDVKVLIFSTWQKVLHVIGEALAKNEVKFLHLLRSNQIEIIEKFKEPNNEITALLLLVQMGAKGLNLIEATHVILVEPLMNPSEELQAVGRVHRIGQTKPTFVHKFLIKNTIEESIHDSLTANQNAFDKDKVTLASLSNLISNICLHPENDDLGHRQTDDEIIDVD